MAMDKLPPAPARPKSKLLKFLPKAAPSAISFHNPPFSPGRPDHLAAAKIKPPHPRSGFHRRNQPKSSGDYDNQEPTSPKISCMGQIKCKKIKSNKGVLSAIDKSKPSSMSMPRNFKSTAAPSRKPNVLKRIFGRGGGGGGGKTKPSFRKSKSDLSADVSSSRLSAANRAPKLSQMQRFSSGRESLVGFDWTAHFPPENRRRELNYFSDEDRDGGEGASDEEDGEPIIPFSAPLVGGGGGGCGGGGFCLQPRKEINLWKRRTMVQPRPLQLNKISQLKRKKKKEKKKSEFTTHRRRRRK